MEMLYVAFRTRIQKVYIHKTQNITPFVLGDHLAHTFAHRGLSMMYKTKINFSTKSSTKTWFNFRESKVSINETRDFQLLIELMLMFPQN